MFRAINSRNALLEIAKHRGLFLREDRLVGTTTGLALRLLGEALLEPGLILDVRDHEGTEEANERLLFIMKDIVGILKLKGFVFDEKHQTLRFTLNW